MGYTFGPKQFPRGSKVLASWRIQTEYRRHHGGKVPIEDATLLDTVAAIVFSAYLGNA